MAEGPDPEEKPLEELQKEVTCAACTGLYQEAKLLSCNHYFCSMCIEKMAASSEGKHFECPVCDKETTLPPGGVAELHSVLFLERMKDIYGKMAKAEGKVEAFCGQCAAENSVAFCRQCADFICAKCVEIHEKLRAFAVHVVISLEDLKMGGLKNIPLNATPPKKCTEHDKNLKYFCFDCGRLICSMCVLFDHKEHKFDILTKCAAENRQMLLESLAPLQEIQANFATAEKKIESEEARIDAQEVEACRSVQQSFEHLKDLLEQRKVELVRKVGFLAQKKKNSLTTQKAVLKAAQKEIQLVVGLVEKNVHSTGDQDMMNLTKQLQSEIEKEVKCRQGVSLEPTASADISWSLPSPNLIPNCPGLVYDESSPPTLFNIKTCEFGSVLEVHLSAPTASVKDVTASLKCVENPLPLLPGEVVQICTGLFSISITPKKRGRHDLIIKVDGKQISGSPFRVFVKLPFSFFKKNYHRVIGCHIGPSGVALNNKKQVLVAEIWGKRVSVTDRNGKELKSIKCDLFRDPRGVAVASNGDIYVADSYSRYQLTRFNNKGELLRSVCGQLGEAFSVKIIDNQVFILDSKHELVRIFDFDYNVIGKIELNDCCKPRDIAQGPDSFLYVASEKKISVYRCAPNGAFMHHLNLTPSSLKTSVFHAMCFDPTGNIVVTDGRNGVYIFTITGECVGHISKEVTVHCPSGVVVDEDGFIFLSISEHYGKLLIF